MATCAPSHSYSASLRLQISPRRSSHGTLITTARRHSIAESKDADEGHIVGRGDEVSVKIVQRLPENDESPEIRIRHLSDQLKRKYHRGSPVKVEERLVKRTNTYTIMAAATPTQACSAGINQDGTDFSYFAQVQLGSANQPMWMLLDTGADSSWVMGSACNSGPCTVHNTYNPTSSTTFKALSASFGVQYGSGSVSGISGTDTVTLAGLKLPISLGIANQTSNDFNSFPMDGILGLSATSNFIGNLVASKALKSNVFGMSLNRASDGANNGEINFGTPDTSRFSGSLTYTSIDTSAGGFWAIPMANVGFGTTQAGITTKSAYIDSGTSFIFCHPDDAKTLHDKIPGATTTDNSTYHVPCSTTTSVTFQFGSTTFTVSSKDWVSQPNGGVCTSNIYGHDIVSGNWLLGDTFLKNVYAVFDVDQNRVGFAPKLAATGVTTSSTNPTTGTATTDTGATFTASTLTASMTASSSTAPTSSAASPGLNGHETSNSNSGSAAAQTAAQASPTSTKGSGLRLRSGVSMTCFGLILALIT